MRPEDWFAGDAAAIVFWSEGLRLNGPPHRPGRGKRQAALTETILLRRAPISAGECGDAYRIGLLHAFCRFPPEVYS